MPKLNKQQQERTEAAESTGFLLPEGRYLARLAKDVTEGSGQAGPKWDWEFDSLRDEDGKRWPGRQWVTTSLSEKSAWKMKEVFEAFGYDLSSDTSEMVGEWVVLHVGQQVAQQGKRKGETVNFVRTVAAYDPDADGEWPDQGGPENGGAANGGDDNF